MAQTTVKNVNAIKLGSAKLEVGLAEASLQDFGAMTGLKFVETLTDYVIDSDNAGQVAVGVANQIIAVTGTWLEPDMTKLDLARGGIDTYASITGASTPITDELVTCNGYIGARVLNRDATGAFPTAITVKHTSGSPTYVLGTDYYTGQDASGYLVIIRKAGGAITDGQTVKVSYTYNAATAKTLKTGGKRTIGYRVVKLTNVNSAGKTFSVLFYKARIKKGIELTYKSDEATEANGMPIEIEAIKDVTRTAGDQLCYIYDEQGV